LETPLPGLFANFYVIGVDGVPLLSLSPDNGRLATVPRSGGKPPWTVKASVLRKPIRDSSVNIFAFARAAAPIGPDKEDATFAHSSDRGISKRSSDPRTCCTTAYAVRAASSLCCLSQRKRPWYSW